MKKTLRGLFFQTESKAEYYYDDCSGMVFPCPDGLKEKLQELHESTGNITDFSSSDNMDIWGRFIWERYSKYGAFLVSENTSGRPVEPSVGEITENVKKNGFRQLILTVTGNCNMKCRYCINSDVYPFSGKMRFDSMPFSVARAAVDYYLDNLGRIRKTDPGRTAVITFYGGEPLLEFRLIQEVVEYVRSKKVKNLLYTITTNGLLLNEEAADFLAAHKFAVWVSIDGSENQHNRNRITQGEKGTFGQVFGNIRNFRIRYPDYYLLGFLVTYDWKTDIFELREFFRSHSEFDNSLFMFNPVGANFTEYYSRFSNEERRHFAEQLNSIKKDLYASSVDHDDPVTTFLITTPYRLQLMRKILGSPGRPEIPATGSCIPGEKICVLPDGRFQPCERVPGLADIGDVSRGLDFAEIARLISLYNQKITVNCRGCPVMQLCKTCFSHFWSGNEFVKPIPFFCRDQVLGIKSILEETYSLIEQKPEYYEEIIKLYHRRYSRLLSLNF
ncbi:MAG: hypothetical protein CVU89_17600 [Firmicutes bacterium HGW-Firmicutes-14]|nr:MAG: hypothetical protein CVU89_17600 [Firmicutes bacterium HGW-Firmicutes-14]